MDKLSLYDFFSFLVPGFIAFEWLKLLWISVGMPLFDQPAIYSDVELGLIALCVSFFSGLVIHRISFYALRFNSFSKFIHWPIELVVHRSSSLKQLMSQMETMCSDMFQKPLFNKDKEFCDDFFSHVYYYLEANDKIDSTKGFQSIYFFLRNLFTLAIIASGIMLCILIAFYSNHISVNAATWTLFISSAIVGIVTVPLARFYRRKMLERLFATYCVLKANFFEGTS